MTLIMKEKNGDKDESQKTSSERPKLKLTV